MNGIYELSTTAKQLNDNGETDQAVALIPYSTWNNRGNAEMAVWIPASAAYARPTPKPTIASRAHSYTVVSAPIQKDGLEIERRDYCYGVNDGKTIYTDGDEFGIVDKSGEIVLRAKYENLAYASPDRYIAEDSDGKWGVITAEGEEIIPFDYASIVQMSTDKSHYFAFEDSDWILIDEKGEQVGTEEFSDFNPRTDAIDQFYSEANQDDEMDYSIDAPAQIEPEEYATDSVAVPVYDYDYAYYDEEVCSQ